MEIRGSKILVVGAGISGLMAATVLQRAGAEVKVLEKGRGFGGRMATRRVNGACLDHGAQFMTVRTEAFGRWVSEWRERGVIREWFRRAPWDSAPEGHQRYCGVNGMTDIGKALGKELDVDLSIRIESLSCSEEGWSARAATGERYDADILILTPPLPQSLALLRHSEVSLPSEEWAGMERIEYEPSLAGLFILDGPSGLPEPGGLKMKDSIAVWIGDNTRKGISPKVNAVTVHSSPEFARQYWDSADEERLPILQSAVEPHLVSGIVSASIHRWRYNIPLQFWQEPFYWNDRARLGMAGDAFGGPRIEGAAVSGLALADFLSVSQ